MNESDYMADAVEALPPGWIWVTLGDTAQNIQYGLTEKAYWTNVGPRFLRITDLQDRRVDWDSVPYCFCAETDFEKYQLRANDLLFARTGATTGKSYLISDCPPSVFASYLIRIQMPDDVDARYLYYFFQSHDYWSQIVDLRKGSAQPGINSSVLAKLIFPLSPLAEQARIVEAIEALFTRLDAGVAALKRLRVHLRRYKAAVLKAACEGTLVPQDPTDEPASALLERILTERRDRWEAEQRAKGKDPRKLKYEAPAAPDVEGLPELPEGWVWATFDQLLLQLRNGFFAGAPSSSPPGIRILTIGAVRPLSVDINSVKYVREPNDRIPEYLLHENDLLFTRYNGSIEFVGVCGRIQRLEEETLYPDKLIRAILANEEILSEYIEYYFATSIPRQIIESSVVSSAGQNGISGPTLRKIPVSLPPINEQLRIVEEVDQVLSVVQGIEQIIDEALHRAERLRQAILREAFAGRLVPQDPADEPAAALLARIQQARGESAAGRKRSKRGGG
ncbi:MAG: restriction endonuclease subunit S [Anaerolineae bacterium]|nr:restriction endonuclease subunit S [Anaerolineae bacterium]